MDANKMHREKARWGLHKNAMSLFFLILEATLCGMIMSVYMFVINHSTITPAGKNHRMNTFRGCLPWVFFYLAVYKLITNKTESIFHLIAENSGFIKDCLNNLDSII